MKPSEALRWARKYGITVESARADVPSLARTVAGETLKGSWWAHPKAQEIFRLSRTIRESPDILVCRVVDGKISYVHRRLWPALVSLSRRFPKQRLAALKEEHTAAGEHELRVTPFPDWVPEEVRKAAQKLTAKEAASQLACVLTGRP